MSEVGTITARYTSKDPSQDLTPDDLDFRDLRKLLREYETLISDDKGKLDSDAKVSLAIEEGSIIHSLRAPLIIVFAFNAFMEQANQHRKDAGQLPPKKVEALMGIQRTLGNNNWDLSISTSHPASTTLVLSGNNPFEINTHFSVNAEYYLYGEITLTRGGNKTPRIEIDSIQFGKVSMRISREKMQEIKENLIYAKKGIHVRGKQDYRTGRPIRNTLEFVDFIEYYPSGVEGTLAEIQEREGKWLRKINPDEWLNEIRGYEL